MEEFQKTSPLARGDKNIKPLEVYAEHAEIRKQVYNEIRKLHDTLDSERYYVLQSIINDFLGCISPLKNLHDLGRLPVYADKPKSKFHNKRDCVWALISCLVQAYWKYKLDDEAEKIPILLLLERLEEINLNYPLMKIIGAENKGYWLEL